MSLRDQFSFRLSLYFGLKKSQLTHLTAYKSILPIILSLEADPSAVSEDCDCYGIIYTHKVMIKLILNMDLNPCSKIRHFKLDKLVMKSNSCIFVPQREKNVTQNWINIMSYKQVTTHNDVEKTSTQTG